jgi:hypothetical protein
MAAVHLSLLGRDSPSLHSEPTDFEILARVAKDCQAFLEEVAYKRRSEKILGGALIVGASCLSRTPIRSAAE